MERQPKLNRFRDLPWAGRLSVVSIFAVPALVGLGLGLEQGTKDIKEESAQVQEHQEEYLALYGLAGTAAGLATGGVLGAGCVLGAVVIDYRKQPQPTAAQSQENSID